MHFRVVLLLLFLIYFDVLALLLLLYVRLVFKATIAIMRSLVSKRHLNLNPVIVENVISQELSLVKSHTKK